MVSDGTLVVAVASVGGTVATVLTITALWVWRYTTALHDEGVEKIATLRDAEWDRAGAELADFFVDVVAGMDREAGIDRKELREVIEQVVHEEVDESEVNRLAEALREVGRGRSLHRRHREGYKDAYVHFAIAAVLTMGDVFLGIVHVVGVLPGANTELGVALLGLSVVVATLRGVLSFRTGRRLKEAFVDAWESARLEE